MNDEELKKEFDAFTIFNKDEDIWNWIQSNYLSKQKVREAIDELWEDGNLQEAISHYGEWDSRGLNKGFEKAKEELYKEYGLDKETT